VSVKPNHGGKSLALRLDDVGASTKQYMVYSRRRFGIGRYAISGNWLFLKYLPGIKAWGPYRELSAKDWWCICDLLASSSAKLTVAVTAAWAENEDVLIPFPERFPDQASVLKEAVDSNLIEIANHGLTHCVLEGNKFKPRLWSSNRTYHREFWEWVSIDKQERHICRAQQILQDYFQVPIVTFTPPGNVFTDETLEIANRYGLKVVSCDTAPRKQGDMEIVGNKDVLPFHDRDIVYGGIDWLRRQIMENSNASFCFVSELEQHGNRFNDEW